MSLRFTKYHGLGNDFLVVDLRGGDGSPSAQDPATVRALCDRRFGVGGDGVLAVLPPVTAGAAARMRVLNADGGEAEMCGNGIRCVVMHLWERDPALRRDALVIDTGAGPLRCAVTAAAGAVESVSVDMGRPRLTRAEIPMTGPAGERCVAVPLTALPQGPRGGPGGGPVGRRELAITGVSMGNPHAVAFVDEQGPALRALAEQLGPAVETHTWFPRRTNAEFARVHGPTDLELVVWERGVGITLACGTGACATAVAACLTGRAQPGTEITVRLLGGALAIQVAVDYSTVLMRGPATRVYEGELELSELLSS